MGINLGGVIAGIDQEWTRQIERREDREDKKIARAGAVEDAKTLADYRAELSVKETNRAERKRLEKWGTDTGGALQALGVEPQYIKGIIALGEGGGNQFKTMIESVLTKDPKADVNMYLQNFGVDNYKGVTEAIDGTTKYTESNKNNVTSMETLAEASFAKVPEIYGKSTEWYAASQQYLAQAISEGDADDIEKYTKQSELALKAIRAAEMAEDLDTGNKWTPSNIISVIKTQNQIAYSNLQIDTDPVTGAVQNIEGKEGLVAIAQADAVTGLKQFNASFKKPDAQLSAQIDVQVDRVKNSLNDWANKINNLTMSGADMEMTAGISFKKPEILLSEGTSKASQYKRGDVIPMKDKNNIVKLYVFVGSGSWLGRSGQVEVDGKMVDSSFPYYEVGS